MPGAAAASVLDRGSDISDPADTQHPLVVDMDAAVMAQVIVEPPVTLIRTFLVDLLKRVRKRSFSAAR